MSLLVSGLKLPLKIVAWLFRDKQKKAKITELEQKQWKHVRNFAPTHYSWQKSIGKKQNYKKKRKRKQDPIKPS